MTSGDAGAKETVFIVDDDPAICEGLCDLLESTGLHTQHFASAEEFFTNRGTNMRGCLVLDVRLPGMSGMELQARLAESGMSIPIIIMTAHGDMAMVRKALKAGAVEFLIKPFHDEELLRAVEQAFALDRSRRQAGDLVSSIHERAETLNERELQVMELVTAGLTNKEIAEKLYLSVATVKLYRGQVMKKMQAESLADLVKMSEKINPLDRSGNSSY
jgi:FixJ family two-component response regulator